MKYYSVESNTIEEVKIIKDKFSVFDATQNSYTIYYNNGHVSQHICERIVNNYFFRSKKVAIQKLNELLDSRIRFLTKEIEILRKYKIK